MRRSPALLLATVALVPALLAGCGSGSSASSSAPASSPASSSAPVSSPPAESSAPPSSAAPSPSASASTSAAPLDREAALVELERQVRESGFSAEAASCIVDWGSSLSDADLAVAAAPPGTASPSAEQQAAQADVLVQCARQEAIDLLVSGFADTEITKPALACLTEYMNGLDDDQLRGLLRNDASSIESLRTATETCTAAG